MFNGRFIYGISLFASKVNKKIEDWRGKGWKDGGLKEEINMTLL